MENHKPATFKQKRRKRFDTKKKFGVKIKPSVVVNEKIKALKEAYLEIDPAKIEKFSDFPLSENTAKALKDANFITPTKIQKESIGLALQGNDILGAAKTGSGKTLAFLIPVLEHLYCEKWSPADGLGALIISPTRELAYQIFEVLRKVGKYHDFSAGLVIGGKHLREEADRINKTNIVICTPGRLLQHMDQTAYFHADNLQILVLDEADRILDLGFQQTMNAIIENLPKQRQTLLFSATQTKSVKDLARLSLKDPMYVSVHEHAKHSTPTQLVQSYLVCDLEDKINLIWSFVKHHLKTKILVFLATCKQVRFVYEVFRHMRPGIPVMSLHGAMSQMKRMAVYDSFSQKQFAVLFATDLAARGLDFYAVNWVVQLDCPEDSNTYIHRVGRTARFEKDGEALLVLLPSEEEGMVTELEAKRIPIDKIKVNPKKQRDIKPKIGSLLASNAELKQFAQRAFVAYLKSVFYMSNKEIFDVTKLDLEAFARSLGLALTPRVRFIEREKKKLEQTSQALNTGTDSKEQDSPSEEEQSSSEEGDLKINEELTITGDNFNQEIDDDVLFKVKTKSQPADVSKNVDNTEDINVSSKKKKKKISTKHAEAKKILKKKLKVNSKVTFDEEGNEIKDILHKPQVILSDDEEQDVGGINIERARRQLAEEDKIDKQIFRERIKQMHRERRLKEKENRRKKIKEEEEIGIQLATVEDESTTDLQSGDQSSGSESNAEWDSADYSDYSEPSQPPAKKMRTASNSPSPSLSSSSSDDDDDDDSDDSDDNEFSNVMDTEHSLADDELLAMKLLQTS